MRIYRKTMEKITIITPTEEAPKAIAYCSDNGYRFIRSGPKHIGGGRYDFTKFRIVAEREINSNQHIKKRVNRADEIIVRLYEMRKHVFLGAIMMQILTDYVSTYCPEILEKENE